MRVKLFLFPLLLCIVPLVLAVLGCLTECLMGGGPHERRVRTRFWRVAGASRSLRWTAYRRSSSRISGAPLERS